LNGKAEPFRTSGGKAATRELTRDRFIQISPEIELATAANKPVVALESTVIAHGLPQPQNLATAQRLEQIIRDEGAIPATIAVLGGKLCVGLDARQLEHLATSGDVRKLSTRDLAVAVANEWDGATTVASTIWIAHRAGIKIFATGGIGGVHRGSLPDVSADLPELARTPMIVVCSGAKIVLDLPATREWLETHGVTVAGYGCDELPAFYSRQSGLPTDVRCDSPESVVRLFNTQCELSVNGALLVTVPVPVEAEIPDEALQKFLDQALRGAEDSHLTGRDLTPFLLARMAALSEGATLRANIALLENNAVLAARIARELSFAQRVTV
jgi:pseudouridylate synthase